MKRLIPLTFILIILLLIISSISNIFYQIKDHVTEMHPFDNEISVLFSSFLLQLLSVGIFFLIVLVIGAIFWLKEYKKIQKTKLLQEVNEELMKKQYELEEQNTLIEELNSQLEDENARYVQQKEILQAIIDSLGAGVMMVDLEGNINFINEAWKDLFNYLSFRETKDTDNNFYIDDANCLYTELFMENMLTGIEDKDKILKELIELLPDRTTRYALDLEQTHPIKRFLHLYSNPSISKSKHEFGRVFVIRDVSHQKEVDRLKLELINTVSHELRTPMSSILGFSELMLTRKLSEEKHKDYVKLINSEARRLTNLINDFLDIQRMESGKQVFNKKFHAMDEIITETINLFKNKRDKHIINYTKTIEELPKIYCDRDKILQVLSNLVSNAIKYSPQGGEIKIDLSKENNGLRVSITDQGLGIPHDVKDKLFTKFFRVENDDRRKIGGTGLGLAISKEIIQAHRGEIGVESKYGEGSTFYFHIPFSHDTPAKPIKEIIEPITTSKDMDLLIVEDDMTIVKLIKEVLKDSEMKIHDVCSGEEALELVKNYYYKLIILDIALSGQLDGWDVLKELKSNSSTVNIPIIISSVYENKIRASQSVNTDFLGKPFNPEQLSKMVHKALNGNLNSKMMVNNEDNLTDEIVAMLSSKGINIKGIKHSGNILIITLNGEEGFHNE